jgi:uncharacterized membrane protein
MKRWLVVAAVLWPLLLVSATWARVEGRRQAWSDVVYLAASTICHQRADRSFHTAGVAWPVCGRCSGLYLAAPFGAITAWCLRRRRSEPQLTWVLVIAALPTTATLVAEWIARVAVTNEVRGVAALSLGAAIAFAIVYVAPDRHSAIG